MITTSYLLIEYLRITSKKVGAIALSYPLGLGLGMVKLSAACFHDDSSITKGGYESAIAPKSIHQKNIESL